MNDKFQQIYKKYRLSADRQYRFVKFENIEEDVFLDSLASSLNNAIIVFDTENLTDIVALYLVQKIKMLCAEFDTPILIKNRADLTFLSGVDGVYLTKNSVGVSNSRKLLGEDFIIVEAE